jgi:hypothetical protein
MFLKNGFFISNLIIIVVNNLFQKGV